MLGIKGWGVRCVLSGLGRLSLPTTRIRFRDGWVRLTRRPDGKIECLLVDREDHALLCAEELDAIEHSHRMGLAVQLFLTTFNKYHAGEPVGDPRQSRMAVA